MEACYGQEVKCFWFFRWLALVTTAACAGRQPAVSEGEPRAALYPAADLAPDEDLTGDFEAVIYPRAMKKADPLFSMARSYVFDRAALQGNEGRDGWPFINDHRSWDAVLDTAEETRISLRGRSGDAVLVAFGIPGSEVERMLVAPPTRSRIHCQWCGGPETYKSAAQELLQFRRVEMSRQSSIQVLTNHARQQLAILGDGTWIAASEEGAARADRLAGHLWHVAARGVVRTAYVRLRGELLRAWLGQYDATRALVVDEIAASYASNDQRWHFGARFPSAADASAAKALCDDALSSVVDVDAPTDPLARSPSCVVTDRLVTAALRIPAHLRFRIGRETTTRSRIVGTVITN